MRVLFVCLGNICRSPLAEAIFKEQARKMDLQDIHADSCGTSNYNIGDDPDPRTVHSARKNNVPISHQARQLTRHDLQSFDIVLAMDRNNLKNTLSLAESEQQTKVKLLREFDPFGEGDVPDPYYGTEKDFDEVFEMIDRSVAALIKSLKS